MASSSDATSSGDEYSTDEGDRELQLALKAGLLNNGLNVQKEKKRPVINRVEDMEQRLYQVSKKRNWLDTLDVSFSPDLAYAGPVGNDFEREACFVKQAQDAVAVALPRLHAMKVPIFRPTDYYAEMAKSDDHMRKVRERLIDIQKTKEKRESAIRLREEKKFSVEVQKAREATKHKERRKLTLAVKNHRKGMKDQLEAILNRKSHDQLDDARESGPGNKMHGHKRKMSRTVRDKKYGYGGSKRRSKTNDKSSFESVGHGKAKRSSGGKFKGGKRGKGR